MPAAGGLIPWIDNIFGEEEETVTYTVTFESNGGSAVAPRSVKKGARIMEPEAPTKSGFVFAGWYSDADLNDLYDFDTPVEEDIILYAAWESDGTYIVTFDLNYAGATGAPASQTINDGGKATLPTEPSRSGYAFTGWSTTRTGETMYTRSLTPGNCIYLD